MRKTQFRRSDNTTKRIASVQFVKGLDSDPDMSYLGEFSNTPDEHHIDRRERGDAGPRDYRYFNLGTGEPDYIEQDYERMKSYCNGDWVMCFCHAVADVVINGVHQEVTSGGIGGVESDSGDSYFAELKEQELTELGQILEAMGFGPNEVAKAFESCEDKED